MEEKKMKNYQHHNYRYYYAQKNGEYIPVSKAECFAQGEEPTAENPFKQRWFYDPEADYAVRLERSRQGEDTYRVNDTSLKSDERHQQRKTQCFLKDSQKCGQDCDRCCKTRVSRFVDLDRTYANNDEEGGPDSRFELSEEDDFTEIIADKLSLKALCSTLGSLLDRLSPDERELWALLKSKAKKQEIADKFQLTLDGVRYREQRLFAKLHADEALRKFFEK